MTEETRTGNGETAESRSIAEIKRAPIVVRDSLALLDTGRFEMMQRVATAMSQARLVPKHLQNSPADCLLVVNQAVKRGMDPLDLAQHTFVVQGKLGYEGKVVAAWINASPDIEGRLAYVFSGEGNKRTVKVLGKLVDEDEPREIEGEITDWQTNNENWKKNPDSMLAYRGAREWARRHVPDLLLGIYTPDELQGDHYGFDHAKDVTPDRPTRGDYIAADGKPVPEGKSLREHYTEQEQARQEAQLDAEAQGAVSDLMPDTPEERGEGAEEAKEEAPPPTKAKRAADSPPDPDTAPDDYLNWLAEEAGGCSATAAVDALERTEELMINRLPEESRGEARTILDGRRMTLRS